jgi:hypothetical protein
MIPEFPQAPSSAPRAAACQRGARRERVDRVGGGHQRDVHVGPGIGVRHRKDIERVDRRPGLGERDRGEAAPAPDGLAVHDLRRHTRRLDADADEKAPMVPASSPASGLPGEPDDGP